MLSEREKNVARKIVAGLSDKDACRKHQLSCDRLVELYEESEFLNYLEVLCKNEIQKSYIELARHGVGAVKKLGDLLDNKKEEVSRRAAVDILNKCQELTKNKNVRSVETQQGACDISDDEARKMLHKLAGSNKYQ